MSSLVSPAQLAADTPIDVALLAAQIHGESGSLVGASGKRKWVFTFADGVLVETRSNLKSEHPDTIRAKKPGMSDSAVLRNCALLRLRNVLKMDAGWTWSPGSAAKEPGELPGMGLLFRAVAGQRDVADLRARVEAEDDARLRVDGELAVLQLPRSVAGAPAGWAGQTVSAALATGPGTEAERATALWFGLAQGALGIEADTEPAPPPAPAAPTLDIASLLDGLGDGAAAPAADASEADGSPEAEEAGAGSAPPPPRDGKNWVPDKVLLPPEGTAGPGGPTVDTPDGFEAAQIEALGDDGPVQLDASFFEALNQRPDRETIRARGSVHTSEDGAPPPEPEAEVHPLERELRALAERIAAAPDHFGVLDVPWDAGAEAFRKAHLQLAQKLHPDRFADATEEVQDLATETFDRVRAAFEVLGSDTARGEYIDKVIHGKKTEDELAMEQVENYWAAEADFKRGLAAFHAGRVREAHELFKSAVEREDNELEFRAYLGFTTFQLHKTSEPETAEAGKEMLKEVLEKNKEQKRKLDAAWVLMGRIFRDQGNDKGARRCFVQALKINTSNGDAQRELRRLSGGGPGKKRGDEAKKSGGFFSRWFGKK